MICLDLELWFPATNVKKNKKQTNSKRLLTKGTYCSHFLWVKNKTKNGQWWQVKTSSCGGVSVNQDILRFRPHQMGLRLPAVSSRHQKGLRFCLFCLYEGSQRLGIKPWAPLASHRKWACKQSCHVIVAALIPGGWSQGTVILRIIIRVRGSDPFEAIKYDSSSKNSHILAWIMKFLPEEQQAEPTNQSSDV